MQLFNNDCLIEMQNIKEKSIDFILCDLPYGKTKATWDKVIPHEKLWSQYERIIKDDGVIALFGIQPFTTELIQSNMKDFRYLWYWLKNNKTGGAYARYQPMRCIEEIAIFYKKFNRYNPQGLKDCVIKKRKANSKVYAENRFKADRYIQTKTGYPVHVLQFNRDKECYHETQKPVALCEYLIKTYTKEGDVVLDNCMGSGSTGVACLNTNRHFIGIEKDEKFFKIACNRLKATEERRSTNNG